MYNTHLLHKTIFKAFCSDTDRLATLTSIGGECPFEDCCVN